ncbi:unnamed protein product [Closterium sp. NIES-54]
MASIQSGASRQAIASSYVEGSKMVGVPEKRRTGAPAMVRMMGGDGGREEVEEEEFVMGVFIEERRERRR